MATLLLNKLLGRRLCLWCQPCGGFVLHVGCTVTNMRVIAWMILDVKLHNWFTSFTWTWRQFQIWEARMIPLPWIKRCISSRIGVETKSLRMLSNFHLRCPNLVVMNACMSVAWTTKKGSAKCLNFPAMLPNCVGMELDAVTAKLRSLMFRSRQVHRLAKNAVSGNGP